MLISGLASTSTTNPAMAGTENKTLMQPQGMNGMPTNSSNVILVRGGWADGSSWGKVITILKNAGLNIVAVQLPLHTLADDVATVKRAVTHWRTNHFGRTLVWWRSNHECWLQ